MKWKYFKDGFSEGKEFFSNKISTIINFVLLSVVYFTGVMITTVFAKISKKDFLDLKYDDKKESYWEVLNLDKKEESYYFKQF